MTTAKHPALKKLQRQQKEIPLWRKRMYDSIPVEDHVGMYGIKLDGRTFLGEDAKRYYQSVRADEFIVIVDAKWHAVENKNQRPHMWCWVGGPKWFPFHAKEEDAGDGYTFDTTLTIRRGWEFIWLHELASRTIHDFSREQMQRMTPEQLAALPQPAWACYVAKNLLAIEAVGDSRFMPEVITCKFIDEPGRPEVECTRMTREMWDKIVEGVWRMEVLHEKGELSESIWQDVCRRWPVLEPIARRTVAAEDVAGKMAQRIEYEKEAEEVWKWLEPA